MNDTNDQNTSHTQASSPVEQIPSDIEAFLNQLLEDAGMVLTDDLKAAMIGDLYARLEKKIIADAIENMQPEQVDQFIELVQSGKGKQEMEQFITEKIPNAKEVFAQSFMDFRNFFLSDIQETKSEPQSMSQNSSAN
ncbi:hypothetical protein GYA49_02425 [Candidatus Beckwithbacteria bacterium]|nr:hypothetical protein [Candidatus Beckwithbacteria bacterium]